MTLAEKDAIHYAASKTNGVGHILLALPNSGYEVTPDEFVVLGDLLIDLSAELIRMTEENHDE